VTLGLVLHCSISAASSSISSDDADRFLNPASAVVVRIVTAEVASFKLVAEDNVAIAVGRSIKKENSYSVASAGRAQWYTSAVISGGKT
jgi:hypothetical protein